jgi:hypothetical protein
MTGPLDWLQRMLGGGDPEAEGAAQASMTMQPNVLDYAQRVLSGQVAREGVLGQQRVPYDLNKPLRENLPQISDQAIDIAMGIGPGAIRGFYPRTPAELGANRKIPLGTLYRGTATQHGENYLRSSLGDLGEAIYMSPSWDIASSYGGGPKASVRKGTRQVFEYDLPDLFPEEAAFMFGGGRVGEPVSLVDGNGMPLWTGDWKAANLERALADQFGIKAVIGTPNSVGLNQVGIRDPLIIPRGRLNLGPFGR